MQIRSLKDTSIEQVHSAFTKAFADYAEPFDKTLDELTYMLQRRGYYPALSFGAFHNDELVSFTLNGIGYWQGLLTAYDTGTGTIQEFRKKGLATKIFKASLPEMRYSGIRQYLLEVIRINTPAIDLYKKEGFNITREFDYFVAGKDTPIFNKQIPQDYTIQLMPKPRWDVFQSFWETEPAWQNSVDAIMRKQQHFVLSGAYHNDELVGYGLIEKHTGDIPQLAIATEHRRKGLGTALVQHLLRCSNASTVRIINSDTSFTPFKPFMQSLNLQPGHGQYEMMRII